MILAQNIAGPGLGTLQVEQCLVASQRGACSALVETGVPHEIDRDHRAERNDEHRREDGDTALVVARATHPPVSMSRQITPKSSSSMRKRMKRGRMTSVSRPSMPVGGHSTCSVPL